MVYAQLAVVSSHLLPPSTVRSITLSMRSFLSTADPSDIVEYEEDLMCVWATLLPYLKLFYLPAKAGASSQCDHSPSTSVCSDAQGASTTLLPGSEDRHVVCTVDRPLTDNNTAVSSEHSQASDLESPSSPDDDLAEMCLEGRGSSLIPDSPQVKEALRWQDLESLKQVSLRMVLFFLLTKLARECHCKVLLEEGLVDFVTCLPWHVVAESKETAEQVVWELSSHVKLQPPRLFNLARAVLARAHFGLENVVSVHSPMELARELLDPSQEL